MHDVDWTLRGLPFSGLEWGVRQGLPALFLHGFLDHAGSWERVAAGIPGWRVALDLRGHGGSAWSGPGQTYAFAEYVADVDALVDQLGARVVLVGHSMGGTLASLYAGARPDRVDRLVLIDGLGLPDGGAGARSRMIAFLDDVRVPRAPRPLASVEEAARRLRQAWPVLDAPFALALATRGTRPVEDGVVWRYDPRHRDRSPTPYRQDQHVQFLEAIACPVLSIHPEDSFFAAADVARLEGAVRDLRVVELPRTGHMLPFEAPELVARHVAAFLVT